MTRARIERLVADAESAYGLCYPAALKALAAVLTAAGVRASSGAGSHVVLLREASGRLGIERDLVDRIDRMRRTRHRVFYDAEEVSTAELRAALTDAGAVIEAAGRTVG